ncbi:hypothetical protein [Mycobacterium sp. C31M]
MARRFDLTPYSTVLSILSAAIGVTSALGATILSRMLAATDSFDGFLIVTGVAAFVGGGLFLQPGRRSAGAATRDTEADTDTMTQ